MQINSLKELFKGVKCQEPQPHAPSLPKPTATPKSERTKVTSNPVREPINKQTALLMRPINCWLSQPLPDRPQKIDAQAFTKLQADLKIERNDHAITRDELGRRRAEVKSLKQALAMQGEEIDRLQAIIKEKDSIIQQLENIRL